MSINKKPNLNKINQIILFSQNYKAHQKILHQIKPCIDDSSLQRNHKHQKLLNQHSRYVNAVQKMKQSSINHQNKKITQKLIEISKPISKQKIVQQNKKSITSRSFWNLKTAKQRKRSKQQRQISIQNKKITQRISKSRSKQNFGRESYYKQKSQTMRDLSIRQQYSQRSQSVLQNLVYNDLKINSKDIPFLPQLSNKYKLINTNQIKKQKNRNSNHNKIQTYFQRESFSFKKQMNFKL